MGTFEEYTAKYLDIVDRGIATFPYRRLAVWKEFFLNPAATLAKDDIGILGRFKDAYVHKGIELFVLILSLLPAVLIGSIGNPAAGLLGMGLIIAILIGAYILLPPALFVYSLLEFVVAKLLGGSGDIRSNWNASLLPGLGVFVVLLPVLIVEIPVIWFGMIPIIGICGSIIRMGFNLVFILGSLYIMYQKYIAFKAVHRLSDIRAAAVVLAPLVLIGVIAVAAVILAYAFIFALLLGSMTAFSGAGGLPG